jgi:hypothetical protein
MIRSVTSTVSNHKADQQHGETGDSERSGERRLHEGSIRLISRVVESKKRGQSISMDDVAGI